MHIVVCVKAVPGSTEVKMDPKTNTIVRDGGQAVINPFDASALETALRIKDAAAEPADVRVSVLSMGIPATADLLRDCIARGADDGLLLSDRAFAGADTLATTYALSRGIEALGGVDLILCGKMAVDGDTAQIGPELAGTFEWPCATDVVEVRGLEPMCACVRANTDRGVASLAVPLPAVLTVSKDIADLRMPSIAGIMAAEGVSIEVLDAKRSASDARRIGLSGSPTQVVRSFVPDRADGAVTVPGDAAEQACALAQLIEGMSL